MNTTNPNADEVTDVADCLSVIAEGERVMRERAETGETYRLISVSNRLRGANAGPTVWELRFKAKRLIPDAGDQEVGAGGEVLVRLDIARLEYTPPVVTYDD